MVGIKESIAKNSYNENSDNENSNNENSNNEKIVSPKVFSIVSPELFSRRSPSSSSRVATGASTKISSKVSTKVSSKLSNKTNDNLPSLTVLIPAYNEEKVIRSTILELKKYLESIEKKGLISFFEIIVCNNASTDKTEDVVKKISKDHSNVRHIKIKAKGMGIAICEGIKNARCDILTFVAADGEVLNGFIEQAVKKMQKYDLLSGSRYMVKSQIRGSSYLRCFLSIAFAFFIRLFFCSKLTEVGTIKVLKTNWAKKAVQDCRRHDASWQVEILYHALKDNLSISEIPVYIQIRRENNQSKVRIIGQTFSFLKTTIGYSIALRFHRAKKFLNDLF